MIVKIEKLIESMSMISIFLSLSMIGNILNFTADFFLTNIINAFLSYTNKHQYHVTSAHDDGVLTHVCPQVNPATHPPNKVTHFPPTKTDYELWLRKIFIPTNII